MIFVILVISLVNTIHSNIPWEKDHFLPFFNNYYTKNGVFKINFLNENNNKIHHNDRCELGMMLRPFSMSSLPLVINPYV